MNKSQRIFEILKQNKLIGLLSPKTVDECITAYETLNPLGVVLEIAFRSEAAAEGIDAVLQKYPDALVAHLANEFHELARLFKSQTGRRFIKKEETRVKG